MTDDFVRGVDDFVRRAPIDALDILTEPELSERLEISCRTLKELRRERKLPFFKIAGKVRYDWERVRVALNAFEVPEASRAEHPANIDRGLELKDAPVQGKVGWIR